MGVLAAPLDCGVVVCEGTAVMEVHQGAVSAVEADGTDPLGSYVGVAGESAAGAGTSAPWALLLDPWIL